MTTPRYLGESQPPPVTTGVLARLGSYFGTGTPLYAMPAPADVDEAEPVQQSAVPTHVCACIRTSALPRETECPIDAQELASGQIAIVIPRPAT